MLTSPAMSIISIGASCQTEWQLHNQMEFIKNITKNYDLKKTPGNLDYIISNPTMLIEWLDHSFEFPPQYEEIKILKKAFWEKYEMIFWHEFSQNKLITQEEIKSGYSVFVNRWNRKLINLRQALSSDRVILFWSNTQNNLSEIYSNIHDARWATSDLNKLKQRFEILAMKEVELNIVSYRDRLIIDCKSNDQIFYLEPDISRWQGDDLQWMNVFNESLNHYSDTS